MNKTKAAFLFAARTLGKNDRLFMWTFTFKDVLNIKDTRKKWNYLLTLLLRAWPMLQGVRVFELHEEHGLHVHLVTNSFIDVNCARVLAEKGGMGPNTRKAHPSGARWLPSEVFEQRASRVLEAVEALGWLWCRLGVDEGERCRFGVGVQ